MRDTSCFVFFKPFQTTCIYAENVSQREFEHVVQMIGLEIYLNVIFFC